MKKHKSSGVDATGLNRARLHHWRKNGILPETHAGTGGCGYSEKDRLAIELAQALRNRGFALSECRATVDWIRGLPKAAIDRMLVGGRRYLVVVGDRVTNPDCLLWRHGELFENQHFPWADLFSVDRPVAVLDVAEAMARVIARVESATAMPPLSESGSSSRGQTTLEAAAV